MTSADSWPTQRYITVSLVSVESYLISLVGNV